MLGSGDRHHIVALGEQPGYLALGVVSAGPGGAAEMVPGQHHVRMNMVIGQVQGGAVRTIKRLGVIDPDEQIVPSAPFARV